MAVARLLARSGRRLYSTPPRSLAAHATEGWLFIDSVFPVQLGRWDIRHYLGLLRAPNLISDLHDRLSKVTTHNFHVLTVEPETKDGGVFVKFNYTPSPDEALDSFEQAVRDQLHQEGALPSWAGLTHGNAWVVRGTPWREDLNRFPSPVLRVTFEGPDIHEQKLYHLLRPYGRINDLSPPVPVPAGTLRSATLIFARPRSAAIARNVMHGLMVDGTTMRLNYQKPVQVHAIRDWFGSHPRITLPLLVFLLGSLTYTIFDPIRSFMVQGKLEDWFDYRKYTIYQWLRRNTLDHFELDTPSISSNSSTSSDIVVMEEGWKERKQAENSIKAYLTDTPTTVAFIHGPQGSGKTRMVEKEIAELGRSILVIDCRELLKATTDSQIVGALATQTGYWPVFTLLNSMSSLIDLASVGLIGQKTGLASSLSDETQQMLSVVGKALHSVYVSHRHDAQKRVLKEERQRNLEDENRRLQARIKEGTWHDGRLDCVSGNGIMSELGVGDELWDSQNVATDSVFTDLMQSSSHDEKYFKAEDNTRKKKTEADVEAISALPIVVIRNFESKAIGGMGLTAKTSSREDILNVLADWAGSLAENQVAHVIVISDNRENAKKLSRALGPKPLSSIALFDADPVSSLAFVKQKLKDAGVDVSFTGDETKHLQRLGGRASDLESMIHKVRNGQTVQQAVEEIITRAVGELRKSAFGDDADDIKGKPWTREQAWKVIKMLSTKTEVSFYDVLMDFPFKGDENALRGMENAELISIGTQDGRPSTIRPGKPVYRWVFERLVDDVVFRSTQEIAINEKQIAISEGAIQKYEDELQRLRAVEELDGGWLRWFLGRRSNIWERERFLLRKLGDANRKVEELDRMNKDLKAIIRKT